MDVVVIFRVTLAKAAQRSLVYCPKAVHSHLQLTASSSDGPAAP